jgi:hypothetical protein
MSTWFECKVKYTKIDEVTGKEKKVTEPYLLDAVSFTDAEKRIYKEMETYVSGEFFVTNIKVVNFSELIPNEQGDRWFKCKLTYVSIDEEAGKERKINSYLLVQSNTIKEAYDQIDEYMKSSVSDYSIPAIAESPILDVFPYYSEEEEIPKNLIPLANAEAEAE